MLKKFWNSEKLGWAAVKFSRALNYVYLLLGIVLFIFGLKGAGFTWAIVGLCLAIGAIISIRNVKKRKHARMYTTCPQCNKEVKIGIKFCPGCGTEIPVQEVTPDNLEEAGEEESADGSADTLNRKKVGFLVGCAVIILAVIILIANSDAIFGGPIYQVKNATFAQYGSQTMEELVDENFKGAKWSSKKIDSDSARVYVEGYMPVYGEDVRVEFYYEDMGNGTFNFSVNSVTLLDSQETYSDYWNISIFMGQLY